MESVLNEIARELKDDAIVGVVDQEHRKLFQAFQVRLIPALFVIRNGEVKKAYEGVVPKDVLISDLMSLTGAGGR